MQESLEQLERQRVGIERVKGERVERVERVKRVEVEVVRSPPKLHQFELK